MGMKARRFGDRDKWRLRKRKQTPGGLATTRFSRQNLYKKAASSLHPHFIWQVTNVVKQMERRRRRGEGDLKSEAKQSRGKAAVLNCKETSTVQQI